MTLDHETLRGRITPFFMYGTAWKEEDTARCVRDALAAGFRAIDTANQRKHYHEAGVGEALRDAFAGGLAREDVFLQTKFTYRRGQDHRLPYDPDASPATRLRQSFVSSLDHLGVELLDSYVLHGPAGGPGLLDVDREVWRAMEALHDEGRVGVLGVSNVSPRHLRELLDFAATPPTFVQNRCYASRGWDRAVREICRTNGITFQGFSLLTANRNLPAAPAFQELARARGQTAPQLIFSFALAVGMLPLTGTTDPAHMREDLAIFEATPLTDAEIRLLESLGEA